MRSNEPPVPGPTGPDPSRPDPETYNVAPGNMPPSPAGGGAETGGEAAASRRFAGLPPKLAGAPDRQPGMVSPDPEPILGFDGMTVDDVLDWIRDADPDPALLRRILGYERGHRRRDPIIRECRDRLRRFDELPPS